MVSTISLLVWSVLSPHQSCFYVLKLSLRFNLDLVIDFLIQWVGVCHFMYHTKGCAIACTTPVEELKNDMGPPMTILEKRLGKPVSNGYFNCIHPPVRPTPLFIDHLIEFSHVFLGFLSIQLLHHL